MRSRFRRDPGVAGYATQRVYRKVTQQSGIDEGVGRPGRPTQEKTMYSVTFQLVPSGIYKAGHCGIATLWLDGRPVEAVALYAADDEDDDALFLRLRRKAGVQYGRYVRT